MPQDVAIDMRLLPTPPPPPYDHYSVISADSQFTTPTYDILFAPSGSVMRTAGQTGKVMLWLRDVTQDYQTSTPTPGEQMLVVIYTRTGLIAVHPIDPNSGNFYDFAQDGKDSGL